MAGGEFKARVSREPARVTLRVPTEDDAVAFHRIFSDAEVMRYIGDGRCRSLAWYREFAERQRRLADESGMCLFAVLRDDEVVGFAGIQPWSQEWGPHGALELGWRLGRGYWGHGYATAAAVRAIGVAARHGVERLVSMVHADNVRSQAVAGRLGMTAAARHTGPLGQPVIEYRLDLPVTAARSS